MSSGSRPFIPKVATIPAWVGFARVLARRAVAAAGEDPLALSRTLVLLPNRRAARALTDAFVAESGGRGLLLPRMIGIVDLDDADAPLGDDLSMEIAPAIGEGERRFRLASLLAAGGTRPAAALREAAGLSRALDALSVEGRGAAELASIDTSGLARHWQRTLARLGPITDAWHALLAERGLIDPAARRVAMAGVVAARWAKDGAGRPVIAAGIVSAPPFVARLLRVVARMEGGQVVLPGLDLEMGAAEWDALDADDPSGVAHPQAALKALLDAIGVARGEVDLWDDGQGAAMARVQARVGAASRALDPAGFGGAGALKGEGALDAGHSLRLLRAHLPRVAGEESVFADLTVIAAANPAEEAQAIALAMREVLETQGRTAALVTPDRALAGRVAAHLGRWGVEVDDSAGVPLGGTPPGAFARLIAGCAAGFAPASLLALLQHPFAGDDDRLAHLDAVRALDLKLRGPVSAGLAAIGRRVPEEYAAWWQGIAGALAPLAAGGARPLGEHVSAWSAVAGALGGERAWTGADGRALGGVFEELTLYGAHLPAMGADEATAILDLMLAETPVRAAYGGHPRLAILGLLEARLQRADLMILGGLNEGVWPGASAPDPWLPPIARRQLGLPPLERRIGLAAHDFLSALGADTVLLSRARRDATAPTSPSRFLLRLDAYARGLPRDVRLLAWARALDGCAGVPAHAPRPRPAPAVALRPRSIGVTEVETLRADPFAYYARAMLRLRRLEPVGGELLAAERGQFLHRVMQRWFERADADPARLAEFAKEMFTAGYRDQPRLLALWRPRLVRAAEWAAGELAAMAAEGWRPLAVEAKGAVDVGGVTLKARADRVDVGPSGVLGIIDYKSGALPTNPQLVGGFALQLGLLAALAERGALDGVGAHGVERLRYWRMSGGWREPGKCKDAVALKTERPWEDADGFVAECWRWLDEVIDRYLLGDAPFVAKAHPEYATGTDYDQLARVDEWQGRA